MTTDKKSYVEQLKDDVKAQTESIIQWLNTYKDEGFGMRTRKGNPFKGAPHNFITGRPYTASTPLALFVQAHDKEFADNRFMTANQAMKNGFNIKREEYRKPFDVYVKTLEPMKTSDGKPIYQTYLQDSNDGKHKKGDYVLDENGEKKPKMRSKIIHHELYSGEQISGMPPAVPVAVPHSFAQAEEIVNRMANQYGVELEYDAVGTKCYYIKSQDKIQLSRPENFESPLFFLRVAAHEFGHATGHKSRTGRFERENTHENEKAYAFEEMRAETFSMIVESYMGIHSQDNEVMEKHHEANHYNYLKHYAGQMDEVDTQQLADDIAAMMAYHVKATGMTFEKNEEYAPSIGEQVYFTARQQDGSIQTIEGTVTHIDDTNYKGKPCKEYSIVPDIDFNQPVAKDEYKKELLHSMAVLYGAKSLGVRYDINEQKFDNIDVDTALENVGIDVKAIPFDSRVPMAYAKDIGEQNGMERVNGDMPAFKNDNTVRVKDLFGRFDRMEMTYRAIHNGTDYDVYIANRNGFPIYTAHRENPNMIEDVKAFLNHARSNMKDEAYRLDAVKLPVVAGTIVAIESINNPADDLKSVAEKAFRAMPMKHFGDSDNLDYSVRLLDEVQRKGNVFNDYPKGNIEEQKSYFVEHADELNGKLESIGANVDEARQQKMKPAEYAKTLGIEEVKPIDNINRIIESAQVAQKKSNMAMTQQIDSVTFKM